VKFYQNILQYLKKTDYVSYFDREDETVKVIA
jgi:hypothetical protein